MKTTKLLLLILLLSMSVFGRARLSGYCQQGGQTIQVLGYTSSAVTPVQGSYTGSGCQVLVTYATGASGANGPAGTVTTNGTALSYSSGTMFNANGQWSGLGITINAVPYAISACSTPQSCTLTSSAGVQASPVAYSMANSAPAAIFSDNNGTVKANPFPSSATGYWFYYADNGTYTIQYSGTSILSTFSHAALPLIDPLSLAPVVNVLAYGAKCDAATNDTPAFTRAIAALPPLGGTVTLPSATCVGHFSLPAYPKSVRVIGSGENATVLQADAANTPLFSLSAVVSNFSSPKFEIANMSLQASASGSTGPMIDMSGMVQPSFHDLTYLSNGSGNYAEMFYQSDAVFTVVGGSHVYNITVFVQSGPTTFAQTVGNSSLNNWSNIWLLGNTGMTTGFSFSAAAAGGNIVDGLYCQGNLAAVCLLPGNNITERSSYYENDGGYITGNGGSNNTFTGDTFSSNHPGTGITGTDGEANWNFTDEIWPTATSPNLTAKGLYGWQICAGNICKNSQGGFLSTKVSGLIVFAQNQFPGGSLSSTSCNGAGVCTYIITAVDQGGNEGTAGAGASTTITGSGKLIFAQADHVTGASYYNVYGPNCPNVSHVQCGYLHSFDATFSAENGILIDDGSFTPTTQVPPTVDHTGDIISQNGLYVTTAPNVVTDTSSTPNAIVASLNISTGWGTTPPVGFTVYVLATAQAITAGSSLSFTLNGTLYQVNGTSNTPGHNFQCTLAAGSPMMMTWNGTSAWISPNCGAGPTTAFVPQGDEQGVNNALIAIGQNITLVLGQPVQIQTAHTCGSGCTIKWNGTVYNLKSGYNPASNIANSYAVGAIITAMFDGAVFQDARQ
jgi:hypothetical protein